MAKMTLKDVENEEFIRKCGRKAGILEMEFVGEEVVGKRHRGMYIGGELVGNTIEVNGVELRGAEHEMEWFRSCEELRNIDCYNGWVELDSEFEEIGRGGFGNGRIGSLCPYLWFRGWRENEKR